MRRDERTCGQWFDALFRAHMPRMRQMALRRLEDRALAEEVVQETFLRLWEKRHTVQVVCHPNIGGWLMKTLELLILNAARRRSQLPLTEELAAVLPAPAAERPLTDMLPAGLGEGDRQLLCWRYQEGLGDDEIAQRLGITPAACRVRLSRARARCARLLEAEEKIFSGGCHKTGPPAHRETGGETS